MVSAPVKPEAAIGDVEIRFPESCPLTDELYIQLSLANEVLRFERSAEGALVIVSFPGNPSADAEHTIGFDLETWRRAVGGHAFGPSARVRQADERIMFADASWLTQEQWDALEEAQDGSFVPVCPTFVVEVRSPGQPLVSQQEKLADWIGYGAQLGWLIDQTSGRVWILPAGQEPEELERPPELSGDPELPGLTVDLTSIWRSAPR